MSGPPRDARNGSSRNARDSDGSSDPRYYPPRPPRADQDEHPGMANYPSDGDIHRPPRRPSSGSGGSGGSSNRWLPPLDDRSGRTQHYGPTRDRRGSGADRGEKSTAARTAAQRSREMGTKMYDFVQRAATADGADKSGLTALTWPVVANNAVDAAMGIALANTLFFAAASGESKSKVALYLLITIAPFAVIAPLIGPALDRLQQGRRVALAGSFALRTVLALILIANFDGAHSTYPPWILYPCALGMMVLSKSFSVLRSAMTPRVLPPTIDLVRVNSRLTTFGLLGGTTLGGGLAAACEYLFGLMHFPGALYVVLAVTVAGAVLSMRIPKWVEVTEGEVPATLSYHAPTEQLRRQPSGKAPRQPLGRNIITSLWGNCTMKVLVGFLFLYPAFVAKSHQDASAVEQLKILGLIGAAAGIGTFAGNVASARIKLGHPARLVVWTTVIVTAAALAAAVTGNLLVAAATALVTSSASAISKASLDASLQDDLPEESRASAFGRSESVLQLAWVVGGAIGVLIYTDLWIGFTAVTAVLIPGLAQTLVSYYGASLIPGLGGNRPVFAEKEGPRAHFASAPRMTTGWV